MAALSSRIQTPAIPPSLASQVHHCLDCFQNAVTSGAAAEAHIKIKLNLPHLEGEVGRFRLWCGNSGAHQSGKASLDYKLREASHIRDQVTALLQSLSTVLREISDIATGTRLSWEDEPASESDSDEEGQCLEDSPTTELEQLSNEVAEINTCLMRLSLAIRNPAPHDQFKNSAHIDLTHFEPFDVDHVRGKFPAAQEFLVMRLGKANSRRRQYLCYREQHRQKLSQGLDAAAESDRIEGTVISSLPSELKDTGLNTSMPDRNDHFEETLSQTSYASSKQDPAGLRAPPLPEESRDGEPFECLLCFRFTSVQTEAAWQKHVYQDLQPYICTYENCKIPDNTYESRREWFRHEMQDDLRGHLNRQHTEFADVGHVEGLLRSCERRETLPKDTSCPLCQAQLATPTKYRRHIGKHFEKLALFVLPLEASADDSSHDEDSNDAENGKDKVTEIDEIGGEEDDNDTESGINDDTDSEKGINPTTVIASGIPNDVHTLNAHSSAAAAWQPNHDSEENEGTALDYTNRELQNSSPFSIVDHAELSASPLNSNVSSPPDGVLYCDHCQASFTGDYKKGNLARHKKAKHRVVPKCYTCEANGCDLVFARSDARLKHHRKHHPQLAIGSAVSRKHVVLKGLDGITIYDSQAADGVSSVPSIGGYKTHKRDDSSGVDTREPDVSDDIFFASGGKARLETPSKTSDSPSREAFSKGNGRGSGNGDLWLCNECGSENTVWMDFCPICEQGTRY